VTEILNLIDFMIRTILIFIFGNLLTSFVPYLYMLTLDRIIAAMAQGIFMSVYTLIATNFVKVSKR